jgi:hypothetical protein
MSDIIEGADDTKAAEIVGRFKMNLSFENWPGLWGLVPGGAQIPPLITTRAFLLDSNAVTRIRSVEKMLEPEKGWWQSILADESTVLNPVPYAMEGGNGQFSPTKDEFRDRFEEAVTNLRLVAAVAQIIEFNEEAFESVYELVTVIENQNRKEGEFLLEVAGIIKNHISRARLSKAEAEILTKARANNLRSDSFSLYAALSSIYSSDQAYSPAREVLKAGRIESTANPYNALNDLSLLRLYVASVALAKANSWPLYSLLTADRSLRDFWMGLGLVNFAMNNDGEPSATFVFSQEMFPCLDDNGRSELAEKVSKV